MFSSEFQDVHSVSKNIPSTVFELQQDSWLFIGVVHSGFNILLLEVLLLKLFFFPNSLLKLSLFSHVGVFFLANFFNQKIHGENAKPNILGPYFNPPFFVGYKPSLLWSS